MPKKRKAAPAKLSAAEQLIAARKSVANAHAHLREVSDKELQRLNARVTAAATERELYLRELKRGE
jgi:hypothetical protein